MRKTKSETQLTLHESLAEILSKLPQYNLGQDPITDEDFTAEETFAIYPELKDATHDITALFQQALTSLKTEMEKKRITDHPSDPFWKDEMSSNAKMTGYNLAISECQRVIDTKLEELK